MKKLKRNASLDGLDLFRRLDVPVRESLAESDARIDTVILEIRDSLVKSLKTPSTVRGWRAQALFASMVVALDGCEMLTMIDSGDIYHDGESVKPADYFLSLRDGRRLIVDVKEFALSQRLESRSKLSASEYRRLVRFAELMGAELYIASYVSSACLWLLLPISAYVLQRTGTYSVTFEQAIIRNEMAILGDYAIFLEPPLELIVEQHKDELGTVDEEGRATLMIGAMQWFAGGRRITGDAEQKIAHFLMMHGGWEEEATPDIDDRSLKSIRFSCAPPHSSPGQSMEGIGSLSQLYSRMFEGQTTAPSGVIALDADVVPGAMNLLIAHDYTSSELPLVRLVQELATGEPLTHPILRRG
jgi:Holliday junction resolvase